MTCLPWLPLPCLTAAFGGPGCKCKWKMVREGVVLPDYVSGKPQFLTFCCGACIPAVSRTGFLTLGSFGGCTREPSGFLSLGLPNGFPSYKEGKKIIIQFDKMSKK